MRIYGYSERGYALVIHEQLDPRDAVRVHTVLPDGSISHSGRWECSVQHLADYDDVYRGRFPRATPPEKERSDERE